MKNLKELEQSIQIEGITVRPINVPEDIPAMLSLFHAANEVDQITERETLEALTTYYENLRNCNVETDSLIMEVDGELVFTGRTWCAQEFDGRLSHSTWGNVHPDWRKKGIGTQAQKWLEERALEVSLQHAPETPKFYNYYAQKNQKDKIEMAKERGFKEERFFFEMDRDLSKPISEPKLPENLEVRPVKEEHYRKIWDASDEAFRDHWGYVESTEQDYERWLNSISKLDELNPKLWKIAWDGDQVAGMVLNMIFEEENMILNIKKGWADPICVRRPWRKKGLATALINESLIMFKEMGLDFGALGVDTNNLNGALGVYKNCGFETVNTFVIFRKPLS